MRNLHIAAALTVLSAATVCASAQTVRHSSNQPDGQATETIDRRLEPNPLTVETLGLTIHPPAGANVAAQKAAGQVAVVFNEPIANPRWTVTIQIMESSLEQPTPAGQVEEHLESLRARGATFEVIDNQPVTIKSVSGQLCFLRQTTASGQPYVSGWLILPAGRRSFLVASSLMMPDAYEAIRPTLEASFNTISLTSQEELALKLRARIEAGRRLLESVDPQRLRSIAANTPVQWRRIYRPSTSNLPDEEVGYMVLQVFAGKRGLLNPGRNPEVGYDATEHEVGLFVRANVRVLEGKNIRDVEMLYWMAWDQSEESFSVRGTRRQGEASVSEAITGLRTAATTGDPIPTLTVVTTGEFTRAREPVQWSVPEVYMSQALNWVLPRLLPRDDDEHVYGYYFFDMSLVEPSLQRRIDTWKPLGGGQWELATTVTDQQPPIVTIYNARGELIRREHPDGSRTVPIDLMELRRIWSAKNLPLNADDLKRR